MTVLALAAQAMVHCPTDQVAGMAAATVEGRRSIGRSRYFCMVFILMAGLKTGVICCVTGGAGTGPTSSITIET